MGPSDALGSPLATPCYNPSPEFRRQILNFVRRLKTPPPGTDLKKIPAREWEFPGNATSTHWAPDMTPMTLAAQKNNYNMVKMLLRRGHVIEMPHQPSCGCSTCKDPQVHSGSGRSSCVQMIGMILFSGKFQSMRNQFIIILECVDALWEVDGHPLL
jgi:hypothetical protein